MSPNFGIKVILFQNSFLSVYHATTVLLRDIQASPDFPGRVLYNVLIVPLVIHSTLFPSSDILMCQILPEETHVQDREPDSPLIDPVGVEGGLVAVDTQTVDSPVRQITNGKEVIC